MTEAVSAVDLVFLWHHHQPDYRSPRDGRSLLPWVRLHASKDYLDMAVRLHRHPRLRAVFNFVPSLLDQLEGVARGEPDALFDLLGREIGELGEAERREVIARCTIAPRYAFERWPAYRRLTDRANRARQSGGRSDNFGDDELLALEVWFLLAWIDPMFHDAPEAAAALATPTHFATPIRDGLLVLHQRLAAEVVPAYRSLADAGQVELSESPYYHPILPLLVGHEAARRARPDLALPSEPFAAPEDATVQVRRAVERHRRAFGMLPAGMWPSEGGVSPEAAEIMVRAGLRWTATDEAVLWGSLAGGERRRGALYRPWRFETPAGPLALFFRDHELSDRIGFVYHHWQTQDAVADFVARVRRVAREHPGSEVPAVVVILDGENCWEHYPDDGGPFLDALYSALAAAPDIHTRTPSEILAARGELPVLERLHSGSWINGDFRIWIGHAEKNRAWDLVSRARKALTAARVTPETHPAAWEALYAAEGSDWFWWLGDDHYTIDKGLFDRLFREHLQGVYERAGLAVPGWLQVPVAPLRVRRDARIMPLGLLRPVLDGRRTNFYEWDGAGHHHLGAGGGSMHRGPGLGRDLFFGFDLDHLYLRIDFAPEVLPLPEHELAIDVLAPRSVRVRIAGLEPGQRPVVRGDGARPGERIEGAACYIDRILELGIPFAALGVNVGQSVEILVHILHQGQVVETLPADDLLRFRVPDESFDSAMWSA